MTVQNWVAKVLAERSAIIDRVGKVEPRPDAQHEKDAIYRAAAALLEWEQSTGISIDAPPEPMTIEEAAEDDR